MLWTLYAVENHEAFDAASKRGVDRLPQTMKPKAHSHSILPKGALSSNPVHRRLGLFSILLHLDYSLLPRIHRDYSSLNSRSRQRSRQNRLSILCKYTVRLSR